MNNKGFTLLELVISIVLVAAIIIPAFAVVLSYKNKMQIASDKQQLVSYKNRLTYAIQTDILTKGLTEIKWLSDVSECMQADEKEESDVDCKILLTFKNNSSKELNINAKRRTISYGDDFNEQLPVSYAKIMYGKQVKEAFFRTYINRDANVLENNSYYYATIFIPVQYVDDTNNEESLDYGIHIVAELAK